MPGTALGTLGTDQSRTSSTVLTPHRSYHRSLLQKVQQGAPAGTDLVVFLLGATSRKQCLMAPGPGVEVTTVSRAQILGPAVAPLSTGKGISAAVSWGKNRSRALRVFFFFLNRGQQEPQIPHDPITEKQQEVSCQETFQSMANPRWGARWGETGSLQSPGCPGTHRKPPNV